MSTLDEITKEKQRVGEALARVDAQRDKLAGQLGELEAAERVLARYGTDTRATKKALAKTPTTATKAAAAPRPRRQRTEEPTFRAAKALNFGSRKKGPVQCLGSRVAAGENPSLRPQSKATTSRSWWVWASRRRDLPVGGEPADRQAIG